MAPPTFEVLELPRPSPASSDLVIGSCAAAALNDQGVVVGSCNQACNACSGGAAPSVVAWMYEESSGAIDELAFDPGAQAHATGISDNGVITGYESGSAGLRPGFWTATGGAVLLSGDLSYSAEALAVNDSGTIVGEYTDSGSPGSEALMWSGSGYAETTLPGLECDNCSRLGLSASAINDAGHVVGTSLESIQGSSASGCSCAVEWVNGQVVNLDVGLQKGNSAANAISNDDRIVGVYETSQSPTATHPGGFMHGFLDYQGVVTDLGVLPGDTDSSAEAVNDNGQIVGRSMNSADASRAFLYENGKMYDLNALIDPKSPLSGSIDLQEAVGISASGWIAVNGTDSRDGLKHAFLLMPSG